MWKSAPPYIVRHLRNNPATFNNHKLGLTPEVSHHFIRVSVISCLLLVSLEVDMTPCFVNPDGPKAIQLTTINLKKTRNIF